ncbi:ectoine/hydroxyectoine ABC transporter substrate-binding protein EhuB [Thioclava sp. BHET1]|nr:ectoine/hydroxyectoine ABC transporter substrate-binding protein EhuB [Thioclava sp. BHET1]
MKASVFKTLTLSGIVLGASAVMALAGPLMDRIKSDKPIRIGFANEKPFAYPGDDGKPEGFVNTYVIAVLKKMGYTNIQPVQTEWGGLIPGLNAGRFDIITGGMNILKSRCENVDFSEPMAKMGDGFIVAKGNPKKLDNYADVAKAGAELVTGAGYSNIKSAEAAGVKSAQMMIVPGPTEILGAVKAGRADAGAVTYFTAKALAASSDGAVEVPPAAKMPESTVNWVGIAFRKGDADFVKAFDKAQKGYLGSDAMMAAMKPYGYDASSLPGDKTTQWVCAHR